MRMGASKRYKVKDCPYCGEASCTSTNDHVIARAFFLDSERGNDLILPQVPACARCNNEKSELELYIASVLLIGSKHPEAQRYRIEKIKPRLDRNARLRNEIGIDNPPQWVSINGVMQQMHPVKIHPAKIERLLELIVRGLYLYHYGKTLAATMVPEIKMFPPEHEAAMWAGISDYFPADVPRITRDLGRGTFTYTAVQSPALDGFTAWVIGMHGNITLHGEGGAADHWWCITRPTREAVVASAARTAARQNNG